MASFVGNFSSAFLQSRPANSRRRLVTPYGPILKRRLAVIVRAASTSFVEVNSSVCAHSLTLGFSVWLPRNCEKKKGRENESFVRLLLFTLFLSNGPQSV